MRKVLLSVTAAMLLALPGAADAVRGQDFEQAPINYAKRTPNNAASRLFADLEAGRKTLKFDEEFGYLPALLDALRVPRSSQTLVFSKTSLQRSRIAPETPRALYFNDDVYIGYCQQGEVVEISATDDELGTVFYTLDQRETHVPLWTRQTDNCLTCHASSSTNNVPGHLIRSVYSDVQGFPILSASSYRTDQTSPLEHRWGGWYVSGTHGAQKHLGNLVIRTHDEPEAVDNSAGQNVLDLSKLVDTERYLTPHSDLVALMVLEHQAPAHNRITHANFATRQALHYEAELNRELGEPAGKRWESTTSRIKSACEPLVEYLLFCDETPLTERIAGSSRFAEEFAAPGPRDKRGRSLRELDLTKRMFRYPCSYLIYSSSFAALPKEAKSYVYRRLHEILDGGDESPKFRHLTPGDRRAVREILRDTLPDFS
ncbi:MAG: hypothetical protein JNL96_27690 [Planctomycetaceae bacterium]|nr:hypothetical protein [Planctomycetaceae bacterium]